MNTNQPKHKISPVAWVPTVYFAMGMPFVVLNMVTALMFKGLGVSDAKIAFWTSVIMFPWTIKPLWSPFLEMFKTKKILCRTDTVLFRYLFRIGGIVFAVA